MRHVIKNPRALITAAVTLILGVISLCVFMLQDQERRFLMAGMILLAWSAVSFFSAFTKSSLVKQADRAADERDRYLVMKSSHKALRLTNSLIGAICLACVVLYAIFRWDVLLVVTITLCATLFLMFFILLFTNLYYESHG